MSWINVHLQSASMSQSNSNYTIAYELILIFLPCTYQINIWGLQCPQQVDISLGWDIQDKQVYPELQIHYLDLGK